MTKEVTREYLLELFRYEAESGNLYWSENRPRDHFASEGAYKRYLNTKSGRLALAKKSVTENLTYNYLRVCEIQMFAHHIVWIIETGRRPYPMLDHKDGDGLNNRIVNLVECTSKINQKNTKKYKNNKTGVTGVVDYSYPVGSYEVFIGNKKLGKFTDFFEAVCARKSAELRENYSERNGR